MISTFKKKILIFGGSGFLASYIFEKLCTNNEIHVAYLKNRIKNDNFRYFKIKKINYLCIKSIIEKSKPDIVINTIAYTIVDKIKNNLEISSDLNVKLPKIISNLTYKSKIKLVHISTDQLFDGKKKVYFENSKKCPLNEYGKQKSKAEEYIKTNYNHLIIRTNFFGISRKNNKSFDLIYSSLINEKRIYYYSDIYFNPIYVADLVNIIEKLLNINARGTYNVSTDKKISKFDFAQMIINQFQFDPDLLIKLEYENDKIFSESRPKNMFLSNKKLKKKLGLKYISCLDGIKKLKKLLV